MNINYTIANLNADPQKPWVVYRSKSGEPMEHLVAFTLLTSGEEKFIGEWKQSPRNGIKPEIGQNCWNTPRKACIMLASVLSLEALKQEPKS